MQNSSTVAKSGAVALSQFTGGSTRDYASRVGIPMRGVRARDATECRLVGPVLFGDVAAFGTLAAAIAWVHGNQRNARQLRLVRQERAQLSKGPSVENGTLLPPSPYPVADAIEFLNGDAAPGAFRRKRRSPWK